MSWVTAGFIVWLIFMALRGWFRGFWAMLGSLIGLVLAYVLAIRYAPDSAPLFESLGVPQPFSLVLAAVIVWVAVAFIVSMIFTFVSSPLVKRQGRIGQAAGALLGVGFGVFSGLVAVWGVAMMRDLASDRMPQFSRSSGSALEATAANFVSRATEASLSLAGASEAVKNLANAAMKQPGELLAATRALAETTAVQDLMSDPQAQELMRANDIDGLKKHPAFHNFLVTPEAKKLVNTLASSDAQTRELATDKLAAITIKMQQMRDNPEAVALAQDPEVVALVEQQNAWKLLSHPKVQRLWQILSENNLLADVITDDNKNTDTRIFLWQDEQGNIHYTDYSAIPVDKRAGAQEFR